MRVFVAFVISAVLVAGACGGDGSGTASPVPSDGGRAERAAERGVPLEPGVAYSYSLYLHCGHEWLGDFNGSTWWTDASAPQAWQEIIGDIATIQLEITFRDGTEPQIEATGLGATVIYRPTADPIPGCD